MAYALSDCHHFLSSGLPSAAAVFVFRCVGAERRRGLDLVACNHVCGAFTATDQ